jgi:hypothetical protein
MSMQFGALYFQLFLALCIGIWLGLQADGAHARVMTLGAQFSFFVGAGVMLFSERGWWPVTARVLELVFWVVSSSMLALAGYILSARVKRAVAARQRSNSIE